VTGPQPTTAQQANITNFINEISAGQAAYLAPDLAGYDIVLNGNGGDTVVIAGDNDTLNYTGTGPFDATIYGNGDVIMDPPGASMSVGTVGNDSFNMSSGSNTIFGRGNEAVTLSGGTNNANFEGKESYLVSGGVNTISISYGDDTTNVTGGTNVIFGDDISNLTLGGGANAVHLYGGANTLTVNAGTNDIEAAGNDSITVGGGNDTIVATGSSTVNATGGNLQFHSANGHTSVTAGSGNATLVGATAGNDTFTGGSGAVTMIGQGNNDVFNVGPGAAQVDFTGGASDEMVAFGSLQAGALYQVQGFNASDTISIAGYSSTQILGDTHVAGNGNTVIHIGGATIELVGFQLSASNGHIN
jgi:Ca2+-binding RTX toxin-like protein